MTASANVELVRSIYAAWDRGDFRSVDWAHPEIEYVTPDGPTGPTATIGLAAMAARWREFLGAWEEFHTDAEDIRPLDHERVLVLHRFIGRGGKSGLELGETTGGERASLPSPTTK